MGLTPLGLDPRGEWNEYFVQLILHRVAARYPRAPAFGSVVDSRMFSWPRGPYGHTGEHAVGIEGVLAHRGFRGWTQRVKRDFQMDAEDHRSSDVFAVLTVCKRGINRSVSCARILSHCLSTEGYRVQGIGLLSINDIVERKFCDGSCDQCQIGNGQCLAKTRALDRASRVWN